MTTYACGHESEAVFLNNNFLSIIAYGEWVNTVGWNGTKEKCWDCWCAQKNIYKEEVEIESMEWGD